VGYDVKAPWDAYPRITGVDGSGDRAREGLEAVLASGVDMEARTTWHPDLLSPDDLVSIARTLARMGVRSWAVQAFREQGTDGSLPPARVYPGDVPAEARDAMAHYEFR
jgi:pyruvate formate lyase activating enzyme